MAPRSWDAWQLERWGEAHPMEPLDTIALWKWRLEEMGNITEAAFRRVYMDNTFQASEVVR